MRTELRWGLAIVGAGVIALALLLAGMAIGRAAGGVTGYEPAEVTPNLNDPAADASGPDLLDVGADPGMMDRTSDPEVEGPGAETPGITGPTAIDGKSSPGMMGPDAMTTTSGPGGMGPGTMGGNSGPGAMENGVVPGMMGSGTPNGAVGPGMGDPQMTPAPRRNAGVDGNSGHGMMGEGAGPGRMRSGMMGQ